MYKLEVLDHKSRERAGFITNTLGSPVPVLLSFDAAVEVKTSSSCESIDFAGLTVFCVALLFKESTLQFLILFALRRTPCAVVVIYMWTY